MAVAFVENGLLGISLGGKVFAHEIDGAESPASKRPEDFILAELVSEEKHLSAAQYNTRLARLGHE